MYRGEPSSGKHPSFYQYNYRARGRGREGGQGPRKARKHALIEGGCIADPSLARFEVVEHPSLVVRGVSQKDTALGVYLEAQCAALILLHMNICKAAKDAKVSNIRFLSIPSLKECFCVHSGGGGTIANVDKGSHRIAPVRGR